MISLPRAFAAVVPPPGVLDAMEVRVASVRAVGAGDRFRWSSRDRWHCTLQFLGAVADVDSLVGVLERQLRHVEPFTVQLGGAGAFPSVARATVLWVGATTAQREVARLAAAVEAATAPLGFAADDRPFRPHVTLARTPTPRDLGDVVTALGSGTIGPAWTVCEVVLLESDTLP
ncbi:MAG TPA: RNA 2',3'-cyclic phosphodiesterase, partial [Acidimicrobiia bacterium]